MRKLKGAGPRGLQTQWGRSQGNIPRKTSGEKVGKFGSNNSTKDRIRLTMDTRKKETDGTQLLGLWGWFQQGMGREGQGSSLINTTGQGVSRSMISTICMGEESRNVSLLSRELRWIFGNSVGFATIIKHQPAPLISPKASPS